MTFGGSYFTIRDSSSVSEQNLKVRSPNYSKDQTAKNSLEGGPSRLVL